MIKRRTHFNRKQKLKRKPNSKLQNVKNSIHQ